MPLTGVAFTFLAPSVAFVAASRRVYSFAARWSPLPIAASEPYRLNETSSQRYCEPFTPLSSRPFHEQVPCEATSVDLPAVPDFDFAFGTRSTDVASQGTCSWNGL